MRRPAPLVCSSPPLKSGRLWVSSLWSLAAGWTRCLSPCQPVVSWYVCQACPSLHCPQAGVWARPETPPGGAWVPLPGTAAADPQALAQALRAADAWRRERLQFAQHAVERADALQAVNEIGIALSSERNSDRLLE